MLMIKTLLLVIAIHTTIRGLKIKKTILRDLETKEEYAKFKSLFENIKILEPFFHHYEIDRVLGKGSYGIAFKASIEPLKGIKQIPRSDIVIKLMDDDIVDNVPTNPTLKDLMKSDKHQSELFNNMRIINYLKSNKVPFIQTIYGYRKVVIKQHKKFYAYNVIAMDYGNHGDLGQYLKKFITEKKKSILCFKSKTCVHNDNDINRLIIELMYTILISFNEMSKNKIIHGDIKANNIFIRDCEFGEFKICPIIGDWDFGYYYDQQKSADTHPFYVPLFRPPEMHFYVENDKLKMIRDGYKFTGEEDLFALGMSMIYLCNKIKIWESLWNETKKIILGMVKPFEETEIIQILNGEKEIQIADAKNIYDRFLKTHIEKKLKDQNNQIGSKLEDQEKIKNGHLLIFKIGLEKKYRWIEFVQRSDMKNIFLEVTKNNNNVNLLEEKLESSINVLKEIDPISILKKDRITLIDALKETCKLHYKTLEYEAIKKKIQEDLQRLQENQGDEEIYKKSNENLQKFIENQENKEISNKIQENLQKLQKIQGDEAIKMKIQEDFQKLQEDQEYETTKEIQEDFQKLQENQEYETTKEIQEDFQKNEIYSSKLSPYEKYYLFLDKDEVEVKNTSSHKEKKSGPPKESAKTFDEIKQNMAKKNDQTILV